ncbi:MAG: glycoside hydrolase [Candidatus Bipolaricaulota bacterium]|nr:glycoside hydrolase [Candidatus Bipolaricaulota bacterium]MDW8030773.1 sialidase family protein [Candidatus Bipolaricaulota bacterium]
MSLRVLWKWSVLGVVLLGVAWGGQAQQAAWQSVVIAEAGFRSGDLVYNSDLAVAPDGTAYVVWAALQDGAEIFLSVVPPGEALQPRDPINVSEGAGGDWPVAPAVALGGGRLCVVWEGWDDFGGDIFIRCSDDGARTWLSDPVKVAETETASGQHELGSEWDGNVDVFVDAQKTVYVTWFEEFSKLVWSKSTDGRTFSPFQVLLETFDYLRWPQWAQGPDGTLYVAYTLALNDNNADVYFFKTADGGATWEGPIQVTSNPGFSDAPEWAFLNNTIYNVNDDTEQAAPNSADIMLTVSPDGGRTWNPSVVIAKDGAFPSIATDGKNLYVGFSSIVGEEQTGFVCSTDGGRTWIRDDIPNSGPNFVFLGLRGPGIDASEVAVAVDAQGNVYVAWARGSRELGQSQIMLAKRKGC